MAQSTAARARGRAGGGATARNPELDATRTVALVAAVVVVVAPAPLPDWLAGDGLSVAALLPAAFAFLAGVAVSHQAAAHASATSGWWTARLARRVTVLVGVGLLLQLLVALPSPRTALDGLLLTGDLARLGVATGLALLLVRLPASTRVLLALVLLGGHALLVLGSADAGGALAGVDARLLAGRARTPIDPDGLTAVAPTLGLVLLGSWLGDWLRTRARGAVTVGVLLAVAAGLAVAARLLTDVVPADPALWTPPLAVGGAAAVAAGLALGQAGTRRALPDRLVATLAVAGTVTLPLWGLAVVADAWLVDTRPVRWLLREVLWPPLGDTGAAIALGLLVGGGLVRLGTAMVDRGWRLRA